MAMSLGDVAIEAPRSEPPSTWSGSGMSGGWSPECQIGVGARLGQILSDTGRWLVEVVYEDLVGGRFPSGRQFCKEVSGSGVVLSRDMMQFDPLELVLELAHLLEVRRHERALAGGLLHDLVDDQL